MSRHNNEHSNVENLILQLGKSAMSRSTQFSIGLAVKRKKKTLPTKVSEKKIVFRLTTHLMLNAQGTLMFIVDGSGVYLCIGAD